MTLKILCFYVFLLSFILKVSAQKSENIDNYVYIKDSLTKEPIPYAKVVINDTLGGLADSLGRFKFLALNEIKKVEFSSPGYTEKILVNPSILQFDLLLRPLEFNLKDIVIKPKNSVELTLGAVVDKGWGRGFWFREGYQVALYIPSNALRDTGLINEIQIYIEPGGCIQAPFRLKVYRANESVEGPSSTELLHKSVIVKPNASGWVKVRFQEQVLLLPPKGLFVAVEWLPLSENLPCKKTTSISEIQGPWLGMTNTINVPRTWTNAFASGWKLLQAPKEMKNVIPNARIRVIVSY